MPSYDIDSSWLLGLEMAIQKNLIFGSDIVFTWGPLSFLTTCFGIYKSPYLVFIFHVFHFLNVTYFIYYLFLKTKGKNEVFFIVLLLLIYGKFLFIKAPLCFLFVSLFQIFYFLKHGTKTSIIIFSIYTVISPFVKVDFGFIIVFYYLIFLIYNVFCLKQNLFFHVVVSTFSMVTIIAISQFLNVNVKDYLLNSWFIINSYNDAMVIMPDNHFQLFSSLIIILLFFISMIYKKNTIKLLKKEAFLLINYMLLIFLLFKYAFLRNDASHLSTFLSFIPLLFLLFHLFQTQNKKQLNITMISIFVLSLCTHKENIFISQEKKFKNQPSEQANKTNNFNDSILQKIGNNTVDFLGSNIFYVHANKLNYHPRPVFQSYSAYSKELIELNSNMYNSPSAPEFIFHEYEKFDNRVHYWNEPLTYLSLLTNYRIEDSVIFDNREKSLLLFKKLSKINKLKFEIIFDTTISSGHIINVPESKNIIYLRLEYEYTILGKIRRFLFQPSIAKIIISGEKHDLVKPIIESGVPINIQIDSFDAMKTLYASNGTKNKKIKNFKIVSNSLWIKNSFKAKFIQYQIFKETLL